MKIRFLLIASAILLLLCPLAMAQTANPDQIVAMGASYNGYAAPNVSGNLVYGKEISKQTQTYSFTYIDVISKSFQPFQAATSMSTGIAQKILDLGPVRIYATTSVGLVAGGEDVGYSWTGGGAAAIPLKKGFFLLPNIRFLTSGITERQTVYGIALGWGK